MGILDTGESVYKLLKNMGTIEAQETAMRLREELIELKRENANLREERDELQATLKLTKEVLYEAPYYWRLANDKKDGPYCQLCFDKDEKLIRLQVGYRRGLWRCECCEKAYQDDTYVAPERPSAAERVRRMR